MEKGDCLMPVTLELNQISPSGNIVPVTDNTQTLGTLPNLLVTYSLVVVVLSI